LFQGQHNDYIINNAAIEYMNQQSLPQYQLKKFSTRIFTTERKWRSFLFQNNIRKRHHKKIATEAALIGSLIYHRWNRDLV
jgi:hypothetical protein